MSGLYLILLLYLVFALDSTHMVLPFICLVIFPCIAGNILKNC